MVGRRTDLFFLELRERFVRGPNASAKMDPFSHTEVSNVVVFAFVVVGHHLFTHSIGGCPNRAERSCRIE
jgi:hypothetical protein